VIGPNSYTQHPSREPFFDVHRQTGVTIEVFYADRTLETFGRRGRGWFWCNRRRGYPPEGQRTGPFATSYAAYRHALGTGMETESDAPSNFKVVSDG
jgi:hypothetical protein